MLRGFLAAIIGGPPRVAVADGVIETWGRGHGARILLAELVEVGILTTDRGPGDDDVFWMLRTAQRLHSIPWSAEGGDKLLAALQTLPGFDQQAVVDASGSAENAAFLAWVRDGAPAEDEAG